jgi:Uma2 family endonuclease
MSHAGSVMTAEELLEYCNEPYRQELIGGKLYEMEPPGALHGVIAAEVGALLAAHVRRHGLGRVFAAATGFHIRSDPDTVRAADASFVTRARIEATGIPAGYWPGPPDLAVEVVSPSDRGPQVEAKALDWLEAGARAVVVLDPPNKTAVVYRPSSDTQTLGLADTLDLGDVVPDFAVPVADLFV